MHKIVRITYVVAGNVRLSMLVVGQFVGYLCCMLSTHVKDGKSAPQWQCVVFEYVFVGAQYMVLMPVRL